MDNIKQLDEVVNNLKIALLSDSTVDELEKNKKELLSNLFSMYNVSDASMKLMIALSLVQYTNEEIRDRLKNTSKKKILNEGGPKK